MSPIDYKSHKLDKGQVRKLIARLIADGAIVHFSGHSLEEMSKDGLCQGDVRNILGSTDARINSDGELEKGSYRYRLETNFIMVVVAFNRVGTQIVVVTVWDKRKRNK